MALGILVSGKQIVFNEYHPSPDFLSQFWLVNADGSGITNIASDLVKAEKCFIVNYLMADWAQSRCGERARFRPTVYPKVRTPGA